MKTLKAILMWLLLFAVPVQGFANSAMAICKASHQRAGQTTTIVHHAKQKADATLHDHSHALHEHHQHHQHHQSNDANASAGNDGKATDSQLSKCSACAASCAGTLWVAVEKMTLPVFAATSGPISYIAFHISGVEPDPPEHPPRLLLA
jgi:hypothetical protein